MKISTIFYILGQGLRNIFRNSWFSLASVATISACLFLFGLFYSVVANFSHIVHKAQQGVSVTVFFQEGTTPERMSEIGDMIRARVEVSKVEFISADQAWEEFKQEYLGEYAEGFPENPLADSDSYQIYLSDVSMQGALVTYLESIPDVRRVNRSEVTATTLGGFNRLLGYVSFGIIGLLLGVSVFLISNTVRTGIQVRKEEIGIMKYIGATDFLVRSPFVIEGSLIGLLGAILPLVSIYYLYGYALEYIQQRFSMLSGLLHFLAREEVFRWLVPISLAVGLGMGFLVSFVAVRKYMDV